MLILLAFCSLLFLLYALIPYFFIGSFAGTLLLFVFLGYRYWSLKLKTPQSWLILFPPVLFLSSYYLFYWALRAIFTVPVYIPYFASMVFFGLGWMLFFSLRDLRGYTALPHHNNRVILNSITLITGYGFFVFLYLFQAEMWMKLLLTFFIMFLLFFQAVLWWSRKDERLSIFLSLFGAFVLTELFWIIGFLPQDYFIIALLLLCLQHMLMGIIQSYCKEGLSQNLLMEYIAIPIILIVVILLTSRWIPITPL
ncbi:MAG: hypothetical protein WCP97_06150 [bacterium]